jgi:hypothetical protein
LKVARKVEKLYFFSLVAIYTPSQDYKVLPHLGKQGFTSPKQTRFYLTWANIRFYLTLTNIRFYLTCANIRFYHTWANKVLPHLGKQGFTLPEQT